MPAYEIKYVNFNVAKTKLITKMALWIHNGTQVLVRMNYFLKHFVVIQNCQDIPLCFFHS